MQRRITLFALAMAAAAGLGMQATAQGQVPTLDAGDEASSAGSVSGQGMAVIKRQPQLLRMKIELTAKGKTLKEALANLKTERESALAKLAKLEADKATLSAGSPTVVAVSNDRQRQMEMMVRQRMAQGGKKPKKAAEPPVSVQSLVTAEWKLTGAEPEAMLLESRTLEDKIRAAGLAAKDGKDKGELSPEDEEAAEEAEAMQQQMGMYDDGSQPKPGEPMFIYVAKVTPEDHAKARAEAFAKAKSDAADLSKAAGLELGALRGLSGTSSMTAMGAYGNSRARYMQQMMMQQMGMGMDGESTNLPNEAIGTGPQEVSLTVAVNAHFALRPAAAVTTKSEARPKK